MSRTKDELLQEALVHFEAAQQYATADVVDQLVIDALCMRLSAGIDVLARLEPPVRETMFGADWLLMWGMRNRIVHGYLLVDSAIVAQTVESDLPGIVDAVRRELAAG